MRFEAIESFYERGWSDGLPIVPPTEDAVDKFLQAAGLAPGHVLGNGAGEGGSRNSRKGGDQLNNGRLPA